MKKKTTRLQACPSGSRARAAHKRGNYPDERGGVNFDDNGLP